MGINFHSCIYMYIMSWGDDGPFVYGESGVQFISDSNVDSLAFHSLIHICWY